MFKCFDDFVFVFFSLKIIPYDFGFYLSTTKMSQTKKKCIICKLLMTFDMGIPIK